MRYYGKVGYATPVEIRPGVYKDVMIDRHYFGEVKQSTSKLRESTGVSDSLSIQNIIEVVADEYALGHISQIRYCEFAGQLWKVNRVEVKPPRLILSIGELYLGPKA